MKRVYESMGLFFTVLIFSVMATAQVATGVPPMSSMAGGPFDHVNLGNLNVGFSIPIIGKPGRGIPFNFGLAYNSSVWMISNSGGHNTWAPATTTWGWQGTEGVLTPYVTYSAYGFNEYCGPNNQVPYQEIALNTFAYYDQWGGRHPLGISGSIIENSPGPSNFSNCPANSSWAGASSTTADGSGYTVIVPSLPSGVTATVTTTSGNTLTVPVTEYGQQPSQTSYTLQDANGNQLSYNVANNQGQFTDTTGNNVLTIKGTAPSPVTYTYPTPGGTGTAAYTVNHANYNIKTNFGCSGIGEYTSTGTVPLVSSVALPDGTSYSFTYEATPSHSGYYTGRIASVTLPTGGSITYQYAGSNDGISCWDGSTADVTRVLNPGGTWTYWRSQVSGSEWQTYALTPPDPQNQNSADDWMTLFFQQDSNTGNYYETSRIVQQAGATTLLTSTTCYNFNNSNCTTTAVSTPITERAVTVQYPNNGQASETVTFFNSTYGFVTETDQYGYGANGIPGSLMRKTQISYASLGNGIVDHPASVTITDGSGNLLSKTTYAYDEYTLQTPKGTSPQHVSVTGSRGNATTISSTVIGSTVLSKHVHYFDTGRVSQAVDVNGATTTYNYPDANSTCGNAFPTSVTLPISGLSSSTSWNCNGDVATQTQDLNGNTTSTNYSDPNFWRPASVVAPFTNTANTTTSFTYTPYNSGSTSLANVDSQMLFNSGQSVVETLTTMNRFGQVVYSQQHEGPGSSNWDSAQVLYDTFLRGSQASMPCVYTSTTFTDQDQACPSSATTTSVFDALGRVTQTTDGGGGTLSYSYTQNDVLQTVGPTPAGEIPKEKQMEHDALGRLTAVCELTNGTGSGACSMATSSPNGYLTIYTYSVVSGYPTMTVSQNVQPHGSPQTRVYTYDLLGRLVSEQNPENGTTTYTYDSGASNCSGTFTGDVVQRKDAANNVRCYTYDGMHRLTSITYPGTTTDSKYFVYDAATVNQATMQNGKGMLVEVYTCPSSGSCSPPKTDIGFSYSPRGEVTDAYESTPNSAGYYHTSASYWENGALQNLLNTIAGLPNVSYGVDPAGRPATATATTNH